MLSPHGYPANSRSVAMPPTGHKKNGGGRRSARRRTERMKIVKQLSVVGHATCCMANLPPSLLLPCNKLHDLLLPAVSYQFFLLLLNPDSWLLTSAVLLLPPSANQRQQATYAQQAHRGWFGYDFILNPSARGRVQGDRRTAV